MKFDEGTPVPGIVLRGNEIGEDLFRRIEEIQALFQLAGDKKSKASIVILMCERGYKDLSDSITRLCREKGIRV